MSLHAVVATMGAWAYMENPKMHKNGALLGGL
jgi:hypothetical protein